MATVYANYAINLDDISLNDFISNQTGLTPADNVNYVSPLGNTYQDYLRVSYLDGFPSRVYFAGTDITYNFAIPSITGGTLGAIIAEVDFGSGYVNAWGVEGFSYSAVAIYDAASTADTADDMAIVAAVLAGNDTITLSSGTDVGNGYAGNDLMRGMGGADTLIGGSGHDTLDGGNGIDRLVGNGGNDRYVVSTGDIIVETAIGGNADLVSAGVNWTLTANVEQLLLTGTAANGTGNTKGNLLTGNGAANTLNGMGGDDSLVGNNGNDNLIGGVGADVLRGNTGNDVLRGGAGNDTLFGGLGSDSFRFDAAPGAGNVDTVNDVNSNDTLGFSGAFFAPLTDLTAANVLVAAGATAALTATQLLIYNTTTGALYYDADGSGAGSPAVQVALFANQAALTADNFAAMVVIV